VTEREGKAVFATTRWSVVLRASGDDDAAVRALEALAREYWYPLYAFVRRQGRCPEDAADLTQAFFEKLLEKRWLESVSPTKGRFRTFLLTAVSHFLANEWIRERRKKRGGGASVISLDEKDAEGRYLAEPADMETPEVLFDRRWALTVLERAYAALAAECRSAGKGPLFEALKDRLSGDIGDGTLGVAANSLGMTEGALKVAVHRMRRRYGELVRMEVGETVADPGEINAEMRLLAEALRR
jgi:RNA polymerase sigma factor (sigma-70 family)